MAEMISSVEGGISFKKSNHIPVDAAKNWTDDGEQTWYDKVSDVV